MTPSEASPEQLKVPRGPEDLSAAWLEAALGVRAGELASFAVEPFGGDQGIVGRLFRVRLAWNGPAEARPESVVLKLTSNLPEALGRPMYRAFFEREIRFYKDIAETSGMRTPVLYWAGIQSETGAAALLMEDLGARASSTRAARPRLRRSRRSPARSCRCTCAGGTTGALTP